MEPKPRTNSDEMASASQYSDVFHKYYPEHKDKNPTNLTEAIQLATEHLNPPESKYAKDLYRNDQLNGGIENLMLLLTSSEQRDRELTSPEQEDRGFTPLRQEDRELIKDKINKGIDDRFDFLNELLKIKRGNDDSLTLDQNEEEIIESYFEQNEQPLLRLHYFEFPVARKLKEFIRNNPEILDQASNLIEGLLKSNSDKRYLDVLELLKFYTFSEMTESLTQEIDHSKRISPPQTFRVLGMLTDRIINRATQYRETNIDATSKLELNEIFSKDEISGISNFFTELNNQITNCEDEFESEELRNNIFPTIKYFLGESKRIGLIDGSEHSTNQLQKILLDTMRTLLNTKDTEFYEKAIELLDYFSLKDSLNLLSEVVGNQQEGEKPEGEQEAFWPETNHASIILTTLNYLGTKIYELREVSPQGDLDITQEENYAFINFFTKIQDKLPELIKNPDNLDNLIEFVSYLNDIIENSRKLATYAVEITKEIFNKVKFSEEDEPIHTKQRKLKEKTLSLIHSVARGLSTINTSLMLSDMIRNNEYNAKLSIDGLLSALKSSILTNDHEVDNEAITDLFKVIEGILPKVEKYSVLTNFLFVIRDNKKLQEFANNSIKIISDKYISQTNTYLPEIKYLSDLEIIIDNLQLIGRTLKVEDKTNKTLKKAVIEYLAQIKVKENELGTHITEFDKLSFKERRDAMQKIFPEITNTHQKEIEKIFKRRMKKEKKRRKRIRKEDR